MYVTPLAPIYIARRRPKCHDCDALATWNLIPDDGGDSLMYCSAHVPIAPHDVTDA